MSGECEDCGEHTLECLCFTPLPTRWLDEEKEMFPSDVIGVSEEKPKFDEHALAARLLKMRMEETLIMLGFEVLDKAGLYEEFKKFYLKRTSENVLDVMTEFGKLHPDKIYVTEVPPEGYAKFIKL